MKPFTLVSTVFNEISRIDQSISDIEAQSLRPNEVIITDAGSKDGTYERLLKWKAESVIPIIILQKERCNVAEGRNMAISQASHSLIASTDFGCRFNKDWLKSIISPFENEEVEVVGGAFSVNEEEVLSLAAKADYVLSSGYPVIMDEYFSVSSRSIAYYKYVWEKVGKYPEWLTLAADDTIFWRLIKKHNFKYELIQKSYVSWMRHKTFKGFSKEAFRYGLGDGESKINYKNFLVLSLEHLIRYSLILSIIFIPFFFSSYPLFFLIVLLVQLWGLRSYKKAFQNWIKLKSKKYDINVFFASIYYLEFTRINYLKGYLKGLLSKDSNKKIMARKLEIS